jgi:hypothetical protein
MAYSASLAERIRRRLARRKDVEELKMFGGLAFFLRGNIAVGVWKESLIVRLGPDRGEEALLEPHVRPFDITGKPMRGWVLVAPEGVARDDQLAEWIGKAIAFARTLPAK